MFPPQNDNQLDDEEIPLTSQIHVPDNQLTKKAPQSTNNKPKIIYPLSCNGSTKSTKFFCTTCGEILYSKISTEISKETWFAVIVLCFFPTGGFCLIPLMIDYMKDYVHTCPGCQKIVGKREYTIAKPLKIIMIVVIVIVVILVIIFLISAIFFGTTVLEEYKRVKSYQNQLEWSERNEKK